MASPKITCSLPSMIWRAFDDHEADIQFIPWVYKLTYSLFTGSAVGSMERHGLQFKGKLSDGHLGLWVKICWGFSKNQMQPCSVWIGLHLPRLVCMVSSHTAIQHFFWFPDSTWPCVQSDFGIPVMAELELKLQVPVSIYSLLVMRERTFSWQIIALRLNTGGPLACDYPSSTHHHTVPSCRAISHFCPTEVICIYFPIPQKGLYSIGGKVITPES